MECWGCVGIQDQFRVVKIIKVKSQQRNIRRGQSEKYERQTQPSESFPTASEHQHQQQQDLSLSINVDDVLYTSDGLLPGTKEGLEAIGPGVGSVAPELRQQFGIHRSWPLYQGESPVDTHAGIAARKHTSGDQRPKYVRNGISIDYLEQNLNARCAHAVNSQYI